MNRTLILSLLAATHAETRRPLVPITSNGRSVVPTTSTPLDSSVARPAPVVRLPLELHTASKMPIVRTLLLQIFVLLSAVCCFVALGPSYDGLLMPAGALQLVSLITYFWHCTRCYAAQLIRRRIESMGPVDQAGAGIPNIRWTARAYHYETRWHRVTSTDSNGKTHTRWESHQVQIATHVASASVPVQQWDYGERRVGTPGKQLWTSVRAIFRVCAEDRHAYEVLRSEFRHVHDRDDHLDFSETVSLGGRSLRRKDGYGEKAWEDTQYFLLVLGAARNSLAKVGAPSFLTYVLVCMLMLSAPYLAWLASKMRAVGGSAAVEYTRTFKLDLHAARAQLDLTGQALSERARALEWRGRWRGLRLLTDVAMHTQRAGSYIR